MHIETEKHENTRHPYRPVLTFHLYLTESEIHALRGNMHLVQAHFEKYLDRAARATTIVESTPR